MEAPEHQRTTYQGNEEDGHCYRDCDGSERKAMRVFGVIILMYLRFRLLLDSHCDVWLQWSRFRWRTDLCILIIDM